MTKRIGMGNSISEYKEIDSDSETDSNDDLEDEQDP